MVISLVPLVVLLVGVEAASYDPYLHLTTKDGSCSYVKALSMAHDKALASFNQHVISFTSIGPASHRISYVVYVGNTINYHRLQKVMHLPPHSFQSKGLVADGAYKLRVGVYVPFDPVFVVA